MTSHVSENYDSVSAATDLAPNELHLGRFPRLSLTVLERTTADGHQDIALGHVCYWEIARGRQRRAYDLVREGTRSMPPYHSVEFHLGRLSTAASPLFAKEPTNVKRCRSRVQTVP